MKNKMKIKRYKYLKEKGMTDDDMFDIVKYSVIPSCNISFEGVMLSTLLLVPMRKQLHYPVWELYLNILILKYEIPENTVEEAVKIGICQSNEEA